MSLTLFTVRLLIAIPIAVAFGGRFGSRQADPLGRVRDSARRQREGERDADQDAE